ncbi:hypothetical protein [Mycolicibacterium porcinum]|uniref:Uncharacterized protein n=1 Tax=Mycolicibacterium porcinum TaxID=39693 RepID=A0ABV3V892_9MYCO
MGSYYSPTYLRQQADLSGWCYAGERWERIDGAQRALEDDLADFYAEDAGDNPDYDFDDGLVKWAHSGAPERVKREFLSGLVDGYIEESASIASLSAYAGGHADTFDLDAVASDWQDWLEARRDAIAEALPDENGSVFEAIGGGAALDELFQKHDKNA